MTVMFQYQERKFVLNKETRPHYQPFQQRGAQLCLFFFPFFFDENIESAGARLGCQQLNYGRAFKMLLL